MVFKARSKQAAPPTRKTLRRGRPHDSGGGLVETSPKDRSRRDSGRTIPTKDWKKTLRFKETYLRQAGRPNTPNDWLIETVSEGKLSKTRRPNNSNDWLIESLAERHLLYTICLGFRCVVQNSTS